MTHYFSLHVCPLTEPRLFAEELRAIFGRTDFPLPNEEHHDNTLTLIWLYHLHKNLRAWNMSHHIIRYFFEDIMFDFTALLNKHHAGIFYDTSQPLCEVLRFGCLQGIYGGKGELPSERKFRLSDEAAYLKGVRRYMEKTLQFCKRLKENPEMAGWYDVGMLYKKYHELEAFRLTLDEWDNRDISDAKDMLMDLLALGAGLPTCPADE